MDFAGWLRSNIVSLSSSLSYLLPLHLPNNLFDLPHKIILVITSLACMCAQFLHVSLQEASNQMIFAIIRLLIGALHLFETRSKEGLTWPVTDQKSGLGSLWTWRRVLQPVRRMHKHQSKWWADVHGARGYWALRLLGKSLDVAWEWAFVHSLTFQ